MKNNAFKIFYHFITTHGDKVRLRWLADKVKVGNLLPNPIYISNQCCTDLCGCISLGQYGLDLHFGLVLSGDESDASTSGFIEPEQHKYAFIQFIKWK